MHKWSKRMVIPATLGALLVAVPAQAAQIRVDRSCYPGTGAVAVKLSGEGYAPGEAFTILINGGVVSSGTVDGAGKIVQELNAPPPPERGKQAFDAGYKLEVRQGATVAGTSFRTAQVFSDFTPGDGDPLKLRVRFSAFGFGMATKPGAQQTQIYVHYVSPKGKATKTVSLGRGQGACGSIRRSARRKLFPFKPGNGNWSLQFDNQKRYVKGTALSTFVWDRITLRVS